MLVCHGIQSTSMLFLPSLFASRANTVHPPLRLLGSWGLVESFDWKSGAFGKYIWNITTWLVVWNMVFMFPLGMSSSQLTNSIIFQRGRYTTNQLLLGTTNYTWAVTSSKTCNLPKGSSPEKLGGWSRVAIHRSVGLGWQPTNGHVMGNYGV